MPVAPPVQVAPGGSISRAQLLAAGRDPGSNLGKPWTFVQLANAALGAHPEDDEVRFLLALAYTRLGLRTAAAEELGRLSPDAAAEPGVAALTTVVGQLPQDQVPLAELVAQVSANLEVLARREVSPVDLRHRVNAWKLIAGTHTYFRARDGNLVWRTRAGAWKRWGDFAGEAAGFSPPHVANPAEYGGSVPGYVVEGIDPPHVLRRIYEQTPGTPEGYRPRIDVLQVDELEFLSGLAHADLSEILGDERVRVHAGKEGVQAWVRELEARAQVGVRIAAPSVTLSSVGVKVHPAPNAIIEQVGLQQARRYHELTIDVARLYAGRERRTLAEALEKPEGVRVLIPTCRYSTFIRHAAADLARSLEDAGHTARILMEPDAHSHLTNVAFLHEIRAFEPDLVVQINYTRRNLGNLAPEGLPWVTWVQDAMSHLFDKAVGESQGATDFLAGNLRDDLFQFFGYARARAMHAPMVASEHKFHAGPITGAQRDRFACDLAFVSHHSQTPEAMHRVKLAEARSARWLERAIEELYPLLDELIGCAPGVRPVGQGVGMTGAMGPLTRRLEGLCERVLTSVGQEPSDRNLAQLMSLYAHPMADRMLRHQTIGWADALARERGWSFKLFGRGWERHPTLGARAGGELTHGDDLRACYQAARAHLHVSAHTIVHQRVFECAMSGGVPLCRLQGDDLLTIEYQAAAQAVLDGVVPDRCEPYQTLALGYRYMGIDASAHPRTAGFVALTRSLGLPEREQVWINQVQLERLQRRKDFPGREHPVVSMLGEPESVLFCDQAALGARLRACIEDDAHRERIRERIRERMLGFAGPWVTYGSFARRLLKFVSGSLRADGADDGREWYDGRRRSAAERTA